MLDFNLMQYPLMEEIFDINALKSLINMIWSNYLVSIVFIEGVVYQAVSHICLQSQDSGYSSLNIQSGIESKSSSFLQYKSTTEMDRLFESPSI